MTYKVMESGLCYDKGHPSIEQAKHSAEAYINTCFPDMNIVTIVNEETDQVVSQYDPVIVWEDHGKDL